MLDSQWADNTDMANTRTAIVEQPGERGSALLGVLLLLLLMSALAAALGVSGQTETLISRNQRAAAQAQAAAEAGLNHAVELAATYISEWNANGFADADAAIDALLLGPDLASGTVATDADNGSLGTRAGITVAEEIPLGTRLTIAAGINADYEAFVMDDELAPTEDGNAVNDANSTLIVQATGYAKEDGLTESKVVLEALLTPVSLPAVLTNGDLDIWGNVDVSGTGGNVHSNADLDITGNATVAGTATASGTYTGDPGGSGGAPPMPVPAISASDYLTSADFILTSTGTMTDQFGNPLACCNNWTFNAGEWRVSGAPTTGTYYVQGSVRMTGNAGSPGSPAQFTIIAEDSIDISGTGDIIPDTPGLMFVTDGDLDFSGGRTMHAPGQILVHEQIKLRGNPEIHGQVIVENAASVSTLVTDNSLAGNVDIIYNGGFNSDVFSVSGWRDVRDAD